MFSSTTNTNSISTTTLSLNNMSPFPQYYFPSLSSSSSPPLNYNHHFSQTQLQPPFSSHDDQIFFHQNNQYDPTFLFPNNNNNINFGPSYTNIIGSCSSNRTSNTIMAGFYSKQDNDQVSMINNNNNDFSILSPKKKPAAKKDRHSKIYTAQGLRDRRVRLSIEIAREFFDLHDTLGFDKASKTLEWLLRKSNKAILELSRGSKSFSSPTNCNSEIDQVVSTEDFDQTLDRQADPAPRTKASALRLLAKESRAKARARARARTREKKYNRRSGIRKIEKCDSSSRILGQFMDANSQLVRECGSDDNRDQFDAAVMIKKISSGYQKLKFPDWIINSSTTSDNQQFQGFRTLPLAETYNNNNNVMSLLPQNWDINCTVSPRSSFSLRT